MKLNIIIVADKRREEMARQLAKTVDADMVVWDTKRQGATANHRAAWTWAQAHPADWTIVLEDDAVPCPSFRVQATRALNAAPTHIVSLYLGKQRPTAWQSCFEWATKRADRDNACWLVGRNVLHAVGLAADRGALNAMVAALTVYGIYAPDAAVNAWCGKESAKVAYSWPSLVDHADVQNLIIHHDQHDYRPGRVAHRHGTRRKWTNVSVPLVAAATPSSHETQRRRAQRRDIAVPGTR
jgi:hypothetical protein